MRKTLFLVIIFCNAFLLFQVQPILTKELLPIFGGSASVWSSSMFFYQAMLFCGYLYAHLLGKLPVKSQFKIHGLLLILATVVTFHDTHLYTYADLTPALNVMWSLTYQVGVAFILLSSTSVLLQQWHIITSHSSFPYHWYSLSNMGSLIALISYPLLFELNYTVSTQKHYWMQLFVLMVILKLLLMGRLVGSFCNKNTFKNKAKSKASVVPKKPKVVLWLAFAATSSIMLIATTQMISTNIPAMPLIWVLPLAIYLISFIYCFSSNNAYQRSHWQPLIIFAVLAGLMMFFVGSQFTAVIQLAMYCFILLICCVVCHGELRLQAPEEGSLTLFYLFVAAGGALGSLFTALIAPVLFDRITEYVLALFLVVSLCAFVAPKPSCKHQVAWAGLILSSVFCYFSLEKGFNQYNVAAVRNFYGYIAVKDIEIGGFSERRLVDGTTVHGSQPFASQALNNDIQEDEQQENENLITNSQSNKIQSNKIQSNKIRSNKLNNNASYYQSDSGVALAFNYLHRTDSLNIGIIGLGAGVLADFSREADTMMFYELNPAVHEMANNYFSYLSNARGTVEVTIGDGRLALEERLKADEIPMDALVIDAFSSDAIPSHLLTNEALALYWKILTPNGLLIIHISNNHIDLMPVINAHSKNFDKQLVKFSKTGNNQTSFGSDWVILTSDNNFTITTGADLTARSQYSTKKLNWTDEHYSLLPLIKF